MATEEKNFEDVDKQSLEQVVVEEQKAVRELAQKKNLIYIGVAGIITVPTTAQFQTTKGIFHVYNHINKPVTWDIIPTAKPVFKRAESRASTGIKVNENIFVLNKSSGFLRPGQSERVEVAFRPVNVGSYSQGFILEDSSTAETEVGSGGNAGVVLQISGDGKEARAPPPIGKDNKRLQFDVSNKEVKIPMTRVGKTRTVSIRIENPTNVAVRLRCKCEVTSSAQKGHNILSVSMPSLTIKAKGTIMLPVIFRPKEVGEIRGVVSLESMVGRSKVRVDVVAEGVGVDYQPARKTVPAISRLDDTLETQAVLPRHQTDPVDIPSTKERICSGDKLSASPDDISSGRAFTPIDESASPICMTESLFPSKKPPSPNRLLTAMERMVLSPAEELLTPPLDAVISGESQQTDK
ncbi:9167_t:CDS:1 [Paraglomus brasilianum]|uniref:9167_t:CDS:1 n=1 Tax=Paraglomus brasilianum TaxID=144538 RepID=A0A9N9CNN0_9GLOM|nr:9167_t:CDS:1 [Paraglomus brasilianum]